MFTLQAAVPASLTAVDDSLTFNAPELSDDQVTAASETRLYVQDVATALAQQKGLDTGPGLYKSQAWYDLLTQAVADYAGWVEIVGSKSVTVNNSTHSGSIDLSAIMGAIMSLYLGPEASTEWSTLNSILGGAEDPAISDFMNFWWSHVSKNTTDTDLSIGPNVGTSDGQVQWAICYYSMTHVIDDWRTMFVSSTYEAFDVAAAGLTLQFDMNIYVNDARSAVRSYLGDDIAKKIKNAPVPKKKPSLTMSSLRSTAATIANAPHPTGNGRRQSTSRTGRSSIGQRHS